MTEEEKDLLIERYLTNDLNEEEIAFVESLRQSDEDFDRNFQAQKIIRDTLKYGQVKANLDRIIEEYSLKESDSTDKEKFIKPWMAVAASIVLLVGFMGYALHKAGYISFDNLWKKEEPLKNKEEDIVPLDSLQNQEDIEILKPGNESDTISEAQEEKIEINSPMGIMLEGIDQTIYIETNKFTQLATGSGIEFSISENGFINEKHGELDTLAISYKEILNKELLKPDNSANEILKVFKISYPTQSNWKIDTKKPIAVSLEGLKSEDKLTIYYGGNDKEVGHWKEEKIKEAAFIKEPTKLMKDYEIYLKSIDLVDSISEHFTRSGNYFISKENEKFRLDVDFVIARFSYIKTYQNNKDFDYKVNLAKKSWETYNAQRNIQVGPEKILKSTNQIYITKPGWYAIVKLDE